MSKQHVYNLIIVDESGSMGHLREATLSGVNETIGTIRKAQEEMKEDQEHFLTLVTFDTTGPVFVRTLVNAVPIEKVNDFTDYHPQGCTPLLDAIGQSVTKLHTMVKDDESASVVVTIVTDGLENASREYTGRQIKALIEQMKEEGWAFSYMGSCHDVEAVAEQFSIDHTVTFDHTNTGARSSWKRDSSAKMHFYHMLHENLAEMEGMSHRDRCRSKASMSRQYYSPRVTPDHVRELRPGEIIVVGAIMGQAEGLQGQTYAIPMVGNSLAELVQAVNRFTVFASEHPDVRFLVTAVGCGNAGFTYAQMAPLFEDCIELENVALPAAFWAELGLSM